MIRGRILVVASRWDQGAQMLVERWAPYNTLLLTPADLSRPGWCYSPDNIHDATGVAGGQSFEMGEIAAVITRLPLVSAHELDYIVPGDRQYVAAEMQAFMLAWLSGLPCPVLNQPTPQCLAGVWWRREQWVHTALQLGIPSVAVHRETGAPLSTTAGIGAMATSNVIVVGSVALGSVATTLLVRARQLAAAAGTELLTATFDGAEESARFIDASPLVDVTREDVADALLHRLSVDASGD